MENIFQKGFFLGVLFLQNVYAQKIISKVDSINGYTYSIHMDSRINDLLTNAEETCNRIKNPKVLNNGGGIILKNDEKLINLPRTNNTKLLSTADICRNSPKLSGYKIQVAVTNNGVDANKIRHEVRKTFPDLRTELDSSLRPNYKILAGSYFSKQSGSEDLRRVRRVYSSAVLVPYRIFCAESK